MSDTKTVTWAQLAGVDTLVDTAPPSQETYTVRRVTRREDMVCPPPAPTVTMPADMDLKRLAACKLPAGGDG